MFLSSFTPVLPESPEEDDWTVTELGAADYNDARLTQRVQLLADRIAAHPTLSLPAACDTQAEIKAAYRLWANPKVTPTATLTPHHAQTFTRMCAEERIWCVEDFSYADYSHKEVAASLGILGNRHSRGVVLAPILALTPDRLCLGVAAWTTWCRDPDVSPADDRVAKQPLDEKESYHWLQGYQTVCDWQARCPGTQFVFVADRGADIFEIYQEAEQIGHRAGTPAAYVLRSCYNRCLTDVSPSPAAELAAPPTPTSACSRKLHTQLQVAPLLGTMTLTIAPTPTRLGRTAHMVIRAITGTVQPPRGKSGPPARVNAVLVQEVETTPTGEPPSNGFW